MSWEAAEGGSQSDYLKLEAGKPSTVRVLGEPLSGWYHRVPGIVTVDENGTKNTVRSFKTFLSNWENEGRETNHAGLKGMKDPMWDQLEESDQYSKDRNGNIKKDKPLHFPMLQYHYFPVYVYDESKVRWLRAGTSLAKKISKIHKTLKDRGGIFSGDIVVDRTGTTKFDTEYNATPLGPSEFKPDIGDFKAISDELTTVLQKNEIPDREFVQKAITGQVDAESSNFNSKQLTDTPTAEEQESLPSSTTKVNDILRQAQESVKKKIEEVVVPSINDIEAAFLVKYDQGSTYKGMTLGEIWGKKPEQVTNFIATQAITPEVKEAANKIRLAAEAGIVMDGLWEDPGDGAKTKPSGKFDRSAVNRELEHLLQSSGDALSADTIMEIMETVKPDEFDIDQYSDEELGQFLELIKKAIA